MESGRETQYNLPLSPKPGTKRGNNQKKAAVKKGRVGRRRRNYWKRLSAAKEGGGTVPPPTPFSQKLWKRKGGTLIEEGLAINFLRVLTKEKRRGEPSVSLPPSFFAFHGKGIE